MSSDSIKSTGAGAIHLIFGPMFSGKSTELLRRIRRYAVAKMSCVIVKYNKDVRYSEDEFSTHDGVKASAIQCGELLADIRDIIKDHKVIGIDEGQFFADIDVFAEWVANQGKIVIVSALDGTYQRLPFNNILQLVPMAETVVKLNAVCASCHGDAAFSARITQEKELEVIGGSEKYVAMCRKCYHEAVKIKEAK